MERCLGCMNEFDASLDVCPHCGYVKGTAEKSKNHLSPGTVLIDRYLIGRCLGQGGFGITYIAWDQRLYKKVAIKEFMPVSLASRITGQLDITCYNEEAQERFQTGIQRMLEESRRLARFNDLESVVKVYDCFEANQTAYIIMELLDGENIKTILAQQETISLQQTARIILPVLQALHVIHADGLIHRDISPDNIFVCKNGKVKLLDFGSARVASGSDNKSLSVILKPGYAPKEQYSATAAQGPFTDVYAVCATIYKMLTGKTPIDSLERQVQEDRLPPIETLVDMPKYLARAIGQGLAIEPKERLQTVEPLLEAFERIDTDEAEIEQRKPAKPAKLPKQPKTKQNTPPGHGKLWVKILVPCLAVLLAGAAVFFVGEKLGWWDDPNPPVENTDQYTKEQQKLLEKALAGSVPTDRLPSAKDREAWEKKYAGSLTYTADKGKLYAEYKDSNGNCVLREQRDLPENKTQGFEMYAFNKAGQKEAYAEYDQDGSILSAECFYYEKSGSLFAKSVYEGNERKYTMLDYQSQDGFEDPMPTSFRDGDGNEGIIKYADKGQDVFERRSIIDGNQNDRLVYEWVQNKTSRRIQISEKDDDGYEVKKVIIDQDTNGRMTKYTETGYSEQHKYLWEFDAEGRVKSHTEFDEDNNQQCRFDFAYGKNGLRYITKENKKAIRDYQYDVTDGSYTLYEYDEKGNLITGKAYSEFEKLKSKTVKHYDSKDRVSRAEYYDAEEKLEKYLEYDYSDYYDGIRAEYDGDVTAYSAYDAQGIILYSVVEADEGKEVFEAKTEYDEQGRETLNTVKENGVITKRSTTEYSADGQTDTYEIYDENGDLTRKTITVKDQNSDPISEEVQDGNGVKRKENTQTNHGMLTSVYLYDEQEKLLEWYSVEIRASLLGQREIVERHTFDGQKENSTRDKMIEAYDDWFPEE